LTRWFTRPVIAALIGLAMVSVVRAQALDFSSRRLERRLQGSVVYYTNKHGSDHRIFSPILGMRRDLCVYLPPGYDPRRAYPLVLFFHMASFDENYFTHSNLLTTLDRLILAGQVPPMVVAAPDGIFGAPGPFHREHSLFINSRNGRFEDHILQEVIPFLTANYSIRPEREAHALVGISAGGYGAMSMAIAHHDYFGAVATLAGALNLRYFNAEGRYFDDFDPSTYRWRNRYEADAVIGTYYRGIVRLRAKQFMGPVFGDGNITAELAQTNPADRLFRSDLQPGQLAIYANYGARDNFNFDAQVESFAWLAATRGIAVTLDRDPQGTHSLRYLRNNMERMLLWLGQHILAPN
jgi:S-formylglutathione hydrolase FrmB